jgi:hypothetical protein
MKIRKGKKKYLIVVLANQGIVVLSHVGSLYDRLVASRLTLGTQFECTFKEAVSNCKIFSNKGYYISKRRR